MRAILILVFSLGAACKPVEAEVGGGDADADGYMADEDCDDADSAVNPGALEYCNGADDDCDGEIDELAVDATTWYKDSDGDGFGRDGGAALTCTPPPYGGPWVENSKDCDDSYAGSYPGNQEICDGRDNDCNGVMDDDYAIDAKTWYADGDHDGFGGRAQLWACWRPTGYMYPEDATDCDDTDGDVYPDAPEVCGDNVVNDCDEWVEDENEYRDPETCDVEG